MTQTLPHLQPGTQSLRQQDPHHTRGQSSAGPELPAGAPTQLKFNPRGRQGTCGMASHQGGQEPGRRGLLTGRPPDGLHSVFPPRSLHCDYMSVSKGCIPSLLGSEKGPPQGVWWALHTPRHPCGLGAVCWPGDGPALSTISVQPAACSQPRPRTGCPAVCSLLTVETGPEFS